MTVSASTLSLVTELLEPFRPVTVRRMFGGAGIYAQGFFFALIDDDVLYFKTDALSRAAFGAEGMGPFTYRTKHGEGVSTSYWRVPERLLDEPCEFVDWARTALTVAQKAAAAKTRPKAKTKPKGSAKA